MVGDASKWSVPVSFTSAEKFWWTWCKQEKLSKSADSNGATIAPIIIVSDKTHLSNFSSDKSAWPVYLTIGNINKATHQQVSAWATILLGYILVIKLECFLKKCWSLEGYHIFHDCMHSVLAPLVKAGHEGVKIVCTDVLCFTPSITQGSL